MEENRQDNTQDSAQDPQDMMRQIQAREKALMERELSIKAREEITKRGLPDALLPLIDKSSEEALEKSLSLTDRLMALRLGMEAAPEPPKAAGRQSVQPGKLSYAQRARLYLTDKEGYKQAFGGNK